MSTISWAMPSARAVSAASALSSDGSSGALTVKDLMLAFSSRMAQQTSAESMPPLNRAPMGTSETRRSLTDSTNNRSVSSTASSNEMWDDSSVSGKVQYWRWEIWPARHSRMVAGGSLEMPS